MFVYLSFLTSTQILIYMFVPPFDTMISLHSSWYYILSVYDVFQVTMPELRQTVDIHLNIYFYPYPATDGHDENGVVQSFQFIRQTASARYNVMPPTILRHPLHPITPLYNITLLN